MILERIAFLRLPKISFRNGALALSVALCALGFGFDDQAYAKFVKFNPPNAQSLHVIGISNLGVIAGDYNNGSNSVGFLRAADGTFTTFNPSGSQTTYVLGMNNKSATVGWYVDPNTGQFAFVRSPTGKFAIFTIGNGATASAISDANVTVGFYEDPVTGSVPGFVRDTKGNITEFEVISDNVSTTQPSGINSGGVITGSYANSTDQVFHGFVRDAAGNIATFDYPGSKATVAMAINTGGTISGYYSDGTFSHGFLRSADGKTLTPIDVPGDAGGTVPTCINANGDIAGYYAAQSGGASLGFIRSAAGKFTTFDPANSQYIVPTGINKTRTVAGTTSISGLTYGFMRSK